MDQIAEACEEEVEPLRLPSPNGGAKRLRLIELLLVLFVAWSPSLVISLHTFIISGHGGPSLLETALHMPGELNFQFFASSLSKLASLGLLVYVLFRQGGSLAAIGFSFRLKDFPISILIAAVSYLARIICAFVLSLPHYDIIHQAPQLRPQNVDFMNAHLSVCFVLFTLTNPFFEELIIRAYTISEVRFLSGSALLAVLVSVGLQWMAHWYQGFSMACLYTPMFFVFSIYYVRWKRITPVILAHLYFDLIAMLHYAAW